MNISNISFPHPVLGLRGEDSSDDIDVVGQFNAPFEIESGAALSVKVQYELLNSDQLGRLVDAGKAVFACEVMCSKSAFRAVYTCSRSLHQFEVNTDLLRDQVTLEFFILACVDFPYADEGGWHPDYKGQTFNIAPGAVLAYGGRAKYQVQRDPSGTSFGGSLINVVSGSENKGPFKIDLHSETITIVLPKKTYVLFDRLYANCPDYAAVFHASLVVPALMQALSVMGSEQEDYQERKWYQAIDTKLSNDPSLNKFEINQQTALEIAQLLMELPFSEVTSALQAGTSIELEN